MLKHKVRAVVLAVPFLLAAGHAAAADAALLRPEIVFTGKEHYEVNGTKFTRYTLSVLNRSEYPGELFSEAPDLPPCGSNTNAARSWVDIYSRDGKRLNGFCSVPSVNDLRYLWVSVPRGQAAPNGLGIEIVDRKLGVKLKSNFVATEAAPSKPK